MTFSIIGTGFIFPAHVEAIRAVGGKIIDIVNTAHGENAWRDMIRTTTADCIVILAPNDLHYPMVCAATDAGKIVLCEKPLTLAAAETRNLLKQPHIFSVLQLRHHPLVKGLKASITNANTYDIEMDISVYRDEKYCASWKGQSKRSGGVLLNLGSHYFDLLLYLFGDPTKITTTYVNDKTGEGLIEGANYRCAWRVSTDAPQNDQRRLFRINGVDYNFSSQDNLSYENLHRFVYRDLLDGTGMIPRDVLPATQLIEQLYHNTLL